MNVHTMSALELVEDLLDNSSVVDVMQSIDPVYLRSIEERARELRMELILANPEVEEYELPPWEEEEETKKPFPWVSK